MQNLQLTPFAIDTIKNSNKLLGLLMGHFDRGQPTLEGWLADNNPRLSEPEAVKLICDNTGLFESQVVAGSVVEAQGTAA